MQHDGSIANQSFPGFRSDLNNALISIFSLNSGPTAPPTTVPGMLWYDTANGFIKQRNTTDSGWLLLFAMGAQGLVAQDGASIFAAGTGATANAYVGILSLAISTYTPGATYRILSNKTCTGASTLNLGPGAVPIKKNVNQDLDAGDIKNGQFFEVGYDGTNFQLTSPTSADSEAPGFVKIYAGATAPAGYLLCNGQAYSRATYSRLYTAIGTNYGSGNGSTTFNVPDLRGCVVIGLDNMGGILALRVTSASLGGANAIVLGGRGGAETHSLVEAEGPEHSHPTGIQAYPVFDAGSSRSGFGDNGTGSGGLTTGTSGSGTPHNNMPPWVGMNYVIKF